MVPQQRNLETCWRRTTATSVSVLFGTDRRCLRDILMRCHGYVLLKCLGDIPQRRCWVFHFGLVWDVVENYWSDVVVTFSWDAVMTFQYDVVETCHSDVLVTFYKTSFVVSFETYLQCHWDKERDFATASPWRLVAGWVNACKCLLCQIYQ